MDAPLRNYLLSLADDELINGYRDSIWTSIAPILEEDISMSSISLDEIGHAKAFLELLADLESIDPSQKAKYVDALALGRGKKEYLHAQLLELESDDWAHTIARRFYWDMFEFVRLNALTQSSIEPLRDLAAKMLREEKYHATHGRSWLNKLSQNVDGKARLQKALNTLYPEALGLFENTVGAEELKTTGVICALNSDLQEQWLTLVRDELARHSLKLPEATARYGGRQGKHSQHFDWLLGEMGFVYRQDPHAVW